jgi:hypothetical protein
VYKKLNKNLTLAKKLFELRQQIKELQAEESVLKEFFKSEGLGVVNLGDFIVSVDEKSRESLDKKSLISKFGQDVIKEFTKTTTYQTVSVKKN